MVHAMVDFRHEFQADPARLFSTHRHAIQALDPIEITHFRISRAIRCEQLEAEIFIRRVVQLDLCFAAGTQKNPISL